MHPLSFIIVVSELREVGAAHGGSSPQGRRLQAWSATTRSSQRGPTTGCPQGVAASRGNSASRTCGRPFAGWLPMGKGSHHLWRGSSDIGNDADGAIGVRASF
ncbi:hypothetical protein B296_00025601 [Ensete ventricosum]|uniref:Uncharacterized protein n=1 Tax=Ensete ventricosum TaxID=4639 RepID=A0A426WZZ8_ENSVE|nr:hypothetical protein B296_00025601 [Ensete ventricosum]